MKCFMLISIFAKDLIELNLIVTLHMSFQHLAMLVQENVVYS